VYFISERNGWSSSGRQELHVVHSSSGAHPSSSHLYLYVHVFTNYRLVHSDTETTRLSGSVGLISIRGKITSKGRKVGRPHRAYVCFPRTQSAHILVLTEMCAVGLKQVRARQAHLNTTSVGASCSQMW
jgi:hypothetical protein